MPQALPAIIAATGTAIATASVYKALAVFVVNIALGALSKALTKRPRDPGPPPVTVSIRNTVEHRRLLVGTRRCAGSFIFYYTSSPSIDEPNKFLWYVIAYVDHQCQALRDAWFDEFRVPDADINPSTGVVSTAWANGKLWVWSHLGTGAQTADAQLTSIFSGGASWNQWNSNDRLRGVCYRVIKMERDDTAWPTGPPDSVASLVDGALLYDPRKDSTNGGSGSHRRDNPSTWEFSRNWALGMRWILSGGSVVNDQSTRIVRYGLREVDARIDDAYIIAAANISDQSLSGANAPPSGSQPRYRLDLEISCGQSRREILEQALAAGAGEFVYVHGKWRLYAGAYDAPVHTFTQDDLRGDLESDDITDVDERVNRVAGVFFDASKQYAEQTTPYRFNSAYDTQDGNRLLPREIELYGSTDQYQCQRVCEIELRKARQMRRVTFRFGRIGMKVAPYETFSMSHSRLGWSSRVFRCIKRRRERAEDGGIITIITARAESSTVYTDLATADYITGTTITNAIQSETPDSPLTLEAFGGANEIEFVWTLPTFWRLTGIVELWESTTNSFAAASMVWEGRGDRWRIARFDRVTRYYWIRVRTIAGAVSATFPATDGLPAATESLIPTFVATQGFPYMSTDGQITSRIPGGVSFSSSDWYSAARSIASFTGDCHVKAFGSGSLTDLIPCAFNDAPETLISGSSLPAGLDFAWELRPTGGGGSNEGYVIVGGSSVLNSGAATSIAELAIVRIGETIIFYKNRTAIHVTSATLGQRLWGQVVFQANNSAAVFSIFCGPTADLNYDVGGTVGWDDDGAGEPGGIRGVESIANRSEVQLGGIGIQITSTSDNDVGYGFPAISIDDSATYEVTIRHKSSASSSSGLYLRMNELNTAPSAGKTHIGIASGSESVCQDRTGWIDFVNDGPMPGTTIVENTYTYTPTAGTQFASFTMYNWTGFSGTYEVQWVRLTKVGGDGTNLLPNSGTS